MSDKEKIQLKTSSITRIPFDTYEKFSFIVNGERFETTRIIAELLSIKICHIHQSDPTIDEFNISTSQKGDFSQFLKLINFHENSYSENEFQFIYEIISQLGNDSLNITIMNDPKEITKDNFLSIHQKYEKYELISQRRDEIIEFIASNLYELLDEKEEEMKKIKINTLEEILNNEKIQINDENQLLHFINSLYLKDKKYSNLYNYVVFANVDAKSMKEFVDIYDINDLNYFTWKTITDRLTKEIKSDESFDKKRYKHQPKKEEVKEKGISLPYQGQNFNGIINYLRTNSNNIEDVVNITSSSARCDSESAPNVVLFEDDSELFYSKDEENQWLCFDFKQHKVILTNYSIKSDHSSYHPKNWVIEGSNDQSTWETIDKQNEFTGLKDYCQTCSFTVQNPTNKSYRYIRLFQTGKSWNNKNILVIGSMELFGTLV